MQPKSPVPIMLCGHRNRRCDRPTHPLRRPFRLRSHFSLAGCTICNSTHGMLPFDTRIVAGRPASEQVIAAVHRATATGRLNPGDAFPSVRELSRELGINPNTAHKIVAALVQDGHLEVHPGLGTRVAVRRATPAAQRTRELTPPAAELALLARRLGAGREELEQLLRREWDKLDRTDDA